MEPDSQRAFEKGEATNVTNIRRLVPQLLAVATFLLAAWSLSEAWSSSITRLTNTGCEEEAFFGIWKFMQGQPVYTDSHLLPFSVSYYNWLFYVFYGGVTQAVLSLFHWGSESIPVITRLITLTFSLSAIAIVYSLLGRLNNVGLLASRLVRLALSAVLVINPLTDSWLLTTRPDVPAITLELAGLWLALRYFQSARAMHLLGAIVIGFLAWSFKHNYVHLLGGLFLSFALRRQWREFLTVTFVSAGLVLATLMIGGSGFRHALLSSQANCHLDFVIASKLFYFACAAAPQVAVFALGLLVVGCWPGRAALGTETKVLGFAGLISLLLGFVAAAKDGAGAHYFIPASIFAVAWAFSLIPREKSLPKTPQPFVSYAVLAVFALGAVKGLWPHGVDVLRVAARAVAIQAVQAREPQVATVQQITAQLRKNLEQLPGPIFVNERACNLPWVQPKAPHVVYSFTYILDKSAGDRFEAGGIGGLIEQGYFETIVVLERHCPCEQGHAEPKQCIHTTMNLLPLVKSGAVPTIDGGRLTLYEPALTDGVFTYYRKRRG